MSKDTTILSDLRDFFSENKNNRAINCIMRLMEHINIRSNQIGVEKNANCKFTSLQELNLLMLFPFFIVKNACRYSGSSLSHLFICKKDMFYRFEMVKYAIKRGIRFDYLLIGSWFTNAAFVRLITSRHLKCNLLGMIKFGNTKYQTKYGELTAREIIRKLHKLGFCKRNATLRCTYCMIDVKYAGTTVRLFFCKRGHNGQWNGLFTTDMSLNFLKAYRIYSMRWATECAYRDCKSLLNLGRCQSVHFSAQIAGFTLTLMQYNILCTVKRFEAYETIGALFAESTDESLELSVTDKIWELILDAILEIAELISADASELLSALVDDNPKFHKLFKLYNLNVA